MDVGNTNNKENEPIMYRKSIPKPKKKKKNEK